MALGSTITQVTDSGLKPGITFPNFVSSGVATATNFKTGTSNLHNVGLEVAQLNVLGGNTKIGSGVTVYFDGSVRTSGIVTAGTYHGSGASLTNLPSAQLTGALPAIDGSSLTGVSGFATALSNTQGTLLNQIFKTPESFTVAAGTSISISSDNMSGNVAFARLGIISVGVGATLRVATGCTMKMNILNAFP